MEICPLFGHFQNAHFFFKKRAKCHVESIWSKIMYKYQDFWRSRKEPVFWKIFELGLILSGPNSVWTGSLALWLWLRSVSIGICLLFGHFQNAHFFFKKPAKCHVESIWSKIMYKYQVFWRSRKEPVFWKIFDLGLILSGPNSVWTANSKMTMLNRTYPWGFVFFLGTFKMLIFFSKNGRNVMLN